MLAGVVLLSLDEAHAALTVALRAAGADPDGWEPSVLLSDVYRRLGRVPDAVAAARRAVAVAPARGRGAGGAGPLAVGRAAGCSAGYRAGTAPSTGRPPSARWPWARPPVSSSRRAAAPLLGGVGLAVFLGVQLYRIETGGTWELVAAGDRLRRDVRPDRGAGEHGRAPLRGERPHPAARHPGHHPHRDGRRRLLWRIAAVHVGAVLPLPALVTTGLVADRAWRGDPGRCGRPRCSPVTGLARPR